MFVVTLSSEAHNHLVHKKFLLMLDIERSAPCKMDGLLKMTA